MISAELAEHLSFDYYLMNSIRERQVFTPQTAYLEPEVFEKIRSSAVTLFGLVERIVRQYLEDPGSHPEFEIPELPQRELLLALPNELVPFFWARYDAFQRAGGGIFFSEFNYDKPCAQRETLVSELMNPEGGVNQGFSEGFRSAFRELWERHGSGNPEPTVGILVDPNHYEETHLAFLYIDLLKPLGYETMLVGGSNLQVRGDRVTAFGKPIDILLRQFPTEFNHELNDYRRILKLFSRGRVLMLNDPRAIVPQAKSLFAYLWTLIERRPEYLSTAEKAAIRETVPYTRMFCPSDLPLLIEERERWVVKAVYGRYSEQVYIGPMMNRDEWRETLEEVVQSGRAHVVQEFVPIKRQVVPLFNGIEYEDAIAFGNFGVYFTQGRFAGLCARWSPDYLSEEDIGWFSPVGVKRLEPPLRIVSAGMSESGRREAWKEDAEKAAFRYGYTTSYTGELESFSLDPLVLERGAYDQVVEATEGLAQVFLKTRRLIQEHYQVFGPLLGIPGELAELVSQDRSPWLTWFGRMDWVFDRQGGLKLLELNTDTPAGLEEVVLNRLPHLRGMGKDPNRSLTRKLSDRFAELMGGDSQAGLSIGMVTCSSAAEDWFIVNRIADTLGSLPYRLLIGDVSGLEYRDGRVRLYGEPLDGLYRYYPLEWLARDRDHRRLLPGLKGLKLVNPPSALIPQSKAFLAVVWQLLRQGFYPPEEMELIEKYMVPSCLEWPGRPCVIKPYLEREGEGVQFSWHLKPEQIKELARRDLVYQEKVEVYPVDINLRSTYDQRPRAAYPILGAFLVGDEFGGLYTRLGAKITDRYAVVCPTLVKE